MFTPTETGALMKKRREIEFPPDFFDPPTIRPDSWPDNLDLRRAVDWFKSFMPHDEWIERREKAARRLYLSALGIQEDSGGGRFVVVK